LAWHQGGALEQSQIVKNQKRVNIQDNFWPPFWILLVVHNFGTVCATAELQIWCGQLNIDIHLLNKTKWSKMTDIPNPTANLGFVIWT
jgi:hypothetical protein